MPSWNAGMAAGCLLLATAGLSACRSAAPRSDDDRSVVRLVYWPPPNRFDIAMSRELVARWNREHPRIQVELQPLPAGRSSEEVLLASIVGKTTPDICSNILTGTVERMVRAGALVALSDLEGFTEAVARRSPPGTLQRFRSRDGKVYQMPWKANPLLLMVNTKLAARAGIRRPPQTYSELLAAAARLTRDTDGDGRNDRWAIGLHMDNTWWKRFDDLYPLYIAASGGQTLVQGERVLFDGPAMVQALGLLRELFARGHAPRSYFAAELFLQSKVAMVPGSGPSIPDIDAKKPPGFRYEFWPLPVPDGYQGKRYTFGDIKSMVIFSSCKHPREAWQFVRYLTSARADRMLLERASQIPLRKDLLRTEPFASVLRSRPRLATLARYVEAGAVRGTDDTVHLVEIFDALSQAYEAGAVHGLRSPAEAVRKAARHVQRVLQMWN